MMGRLFRGGLSLFVYFCLATVIAQVALLLYLASAWQVDRDKLVQIVAIAQGIDLFAMYDEAQGGDEDLSFEQVSFDQVLEQRALTVQHLQLREQSLRDALAQLAFEQRQLRDEQKRYKQVREAFDKQLDGMQESALAAGMENARIKLESLKPKQAKEILAQMLQDEQLDAVVALLADMPTMKSSKIMTEFKTPAELEQLNEILQRIREGYPDYQLADETEKQLRQPGGQQP